METRLYTVEIVEVWRRRLTFPTAKAGGFLPLVEIADALIYTARPAYVRVNPL